MLEKTRSGWWVKSRPTQKNSISQKHKNREDGLGQRSRMEKAQKTQKKKPVTRKHKEPVTKKDRIVLRKLKELQRSNAVQSREKKKE